MSYNSEENNTDMILGISALGLEKGFGKEARRRLRKQGSSAPDTWRLGLAGKGSGEVLFSQPLPPPPHRH